MITANICGCWVLCYCMPQSLWSLLALSYDVFCLLQSTYICSQRTFVASLHVSAIVMYLKCIVHCTQQSLREAAIIWIHLFAIVGSSLQSWPWKPCQAACGLIETCQLHLCRLLCRKRCSTTDAEISTCVWRTSSERRLGKPAQNCHCCFNMRRCTESCSSCIATLWFPIGGWQTLWKQNTKEKNNKSAENLQQWRRSSAAIQFGLGRPSGEFSRATRPAGSMCLLRLLQYGNTAHTTTRM